MPKSQVPAVSVLMYTTFEFADNALDAIAILLFVLTKNDSCAESLFIIIASGVPSACREIKSLLSAHVIPILFG